MPPAVGKNNCKIKLNIIRNAGNILSRCFILIFIHPSYFQTVYFTTVFIAQCGRETKELIGNYEFAFGYFKKQCFRSHITSNLN